jgi:hypothetical protein
MPRLSFLGLLFCFFLELLYQVHPLPALAAPVYLELKFERWDTHTVPLPHDFLQPGSGIRPAVPGLWIVE